MDVVCAACCILINEIPIIVDIPYPDYCILIRQVVLVMLEVVHSVGNHHRPPRWAQLPLVESHTGISVISPIGP